MVVQVDDNMIIDGLQAPSPVTVMVDGVEILRDGKNDWAGRKVRTNLASVAVGQIDPKVGDRMAVCGDDLVSRGRKLHQAWFCRNRFCPMCQWRKSLKTYAQMSRVVQFLQEQGLTRYLFVSLTVRNCEGDKLSSTLDQMMAGWCRLLKTPEFSKGAIKGYYRNLEVTHNTCPDNSNYDTYHPHFHAIFVVDGSYFMGNRYCSYERLRELWRKAMDLDYDPQVNIKAVKEDSPEQMMRAVCEISKYAIKDADYIIPDDWKLTETTLSVLVPALKGRRLVAYGGVIRKARQVLNLDDVETGDLVHIDDEKRELSESEAEIRVTFRSGFNQYIRVG